MANRIKTIGAAVAVLLLWVAWNYFLESRQFRFERQVNETIKRVPGARLIGSYKSADLADPVTWFWAPTTQLTYARPDVLSPVPRFYIMSFHYGENPAVWLAEPDCRARAEITYFPDTKDNAGKPARNVLGEPVKAPNGSLFRRYNTGIAPSNDEIHQLCDTDWTGEKQAATTPIVSQSPSSS